MIMLSMILATASIVTPVARAQLRIATYNTLDGPSSAAEEALVQTIFGAIGNETYNGITKRVDIVGLQEQSTITNPDTAVRFATALNNLYGVSSYQASIQDIGLDSIAYVYDSASVQLVSGSLVSIGIRPAHRIQWRPVGYDNSAADFYTYNVHLKAGSDASDATQRAIEATNIRNNADLLGDGAQIIYMGDFNLQGPGEQAYVNLTSTGNGQAFDPIALANWSGLAGASHHTQSTRTSRLSDGGANGGMDDRFDLQLLSAELLDGRGMSYIGPTSTGGGSLVHSYRAFGNDGTSFDQAINANTVGRSQPAAVLNALHHFTDHLPVVVDYQLPAKAALTIEPESTRMIVGEFALVNARVENVAPALAAVGADDLNYSLSASGEASVPVGVYFGSVDALAGENTHVFVAAPPSAGESQIDYNLISDDQGQSNGLLTESITVTGVDHSNASFDGSADQDTLIIDFGQQLLGANGGTVGQSFDVFNLESTVGFTSDLIISSPTAINGDTDELILFDLPATVTAGGSATGVAAIDTTSTGSFSATWRIAVSDEAIKGATSGFLDVTLMGEVIAALLGDFDGSGDVGQGDLNLVLNNWGDAVVDGESPDPLWVNASDVTAGLIGQDELALVLQNWGDTIGIAASLGQISLSTGLSEAQIAALVPEPGTLALLALTGLLTGRRRCGSKA